MKKMKFDSLLMGNIKNDRPNPRRGDRLESMGDNSGKYYQVFMRLFP